MARKTLLRSVAALSLALSLLAGALVAGALIAPASGSHDPRYRHWGSTDGRNAVLRFGCNNYKYTYVINPPDREWSAELFLDDPTGETLASAAFDNFSEPKRGSATWRICKPSTRPGRFKIRMKITTYVSSQDFRVGWVEPSYFRLRKAS